MSRIVTAATALTLFGSGLASPGAAQAPSEQMNFFITSEGPGDGANLGGIEGADAHCTALAEAVGSQGYVWRAYLSAIPQDATAVVHARDRIGTGPWYNYNGVMVAENLAQLHSEENNLGKETSLTEKGGMVNGRGDSPNMHDIITGTNLDGTAFMADGYDNCGNWTSNGEGSVRVGHHDRTGGGDNPTSWNSAHNSRGCSQQNLQGTGGNGLFYCFGIPAGAAASPALPSRR